MSVCLSVVCGVFYQVDVSASGDHSSIEVLPNVVAEPHTAGLGPLGLSSHEGGGGRECKFNMVLPMKA